MSDDRFVEGSREIGVDKFTLDQGLGYEAADELEVVEVVRVDV